MCGFVGPVLRWLICLVSWHADLWAEEVTIFCVGIWLNKDCGWKKCGFKLVDVTFDYIISMHFLYVVCLIKSSNVSWMEDFIPSTTLLSRSSPIPTTIAMRANPQSATTIIEVHEGKKICWHF